MATKQHKKVTTPKSKKALQDKLVGAKATKKDKSTERTYRLDFFEPVLTGTPSKYSITQRWQTMVVHEVSSDDSLEHPYSKGSIALAMRFPAILPEYWSTYAGGTILVIERPGHAAYLVQKNRIDDLHGTGPSYGGMVETTNPVAFDSDPNLGYLLHLVNSDVDTEGDWDSDELMDEVHEGGIPWDQTQYNQRLRALSRVKPIIEAWKKGEPISPPWVRWTYGQSIVLAKTIDCLIEVQDSAERKEEGRTFEAAVETVLQGFNNHY